MQTSTSYGPLDIDTAQGYYPVQADTASSYSALQPAFRRSAAFDAKQGTTLMTGSHNPPYFTAGASAVTDAYNAITQPTQLAYQHPSNFASGRSVSYGSSIIDTSIPVYHNIAPAYTPYSGSVNIAPVSYGSSPRAFSVPPTNTFQVQDTPHTRNNSARPPASPQKALRFIPIDPTRTHQAPRMNLLRNQGPHQDTHTSGQASRLRGGFETSMDTGGVPPSSSPLGSPRFSADDQQTIYRYMRAVADHLDPSAVARKGMNELFVRTSWWFLLEKSTKKGNPESESESESEPELDLIASAEAHESDGATTPFPKPLHDLAHCLWDSCTGTIAARDLESVRAHFVEAHPEGRRWFGSQRIVCRWAECARWDYMERRRIPGHVVRMHLREHECPFRTCGMVFGSKDDVRVHLQLAHDGSEYDEASE